MSKEINIKDLNASPIYVYGPMAAKWCVRISMVLTIIAIFTSPSVTKPKQALAACPSGTISCNPNAGLAVDCNYNPAASDYCMPYSTGGNNGQANVPEMPAVLVPLFLAVSGGLAYRVRRKHLKGA